MRRSADPIAASMSPDKRGQGAVYLVLSKMYFVLTGYGTYMLLSRIVPQKDFGNYGVVIGLISTLNMMFIRGASQAVSKLTAERQSADSVYSPAMKLNILASLAVGGLLFLFAESIARWFRDPELSIGLSIGGGVLVAYAVYAVCAGVYNGLKAFKTQGIVDMFSSTVKVVGVVAMALWTGTWVGALNGFLIASVLTAVWSMYVAKPLISKSAGIPLSMSRLARLEFNLMLLGLIVNLMMNTDLFFVKRFVGPTLPEAVGHFTAALTLARIPFMLLASISLVSFPIVAESSSKLDSARIRQAIQNSLRICMISSTLFVALVLSAPAESLVFVYPKSYEAAAPALGMLTQGYFLFTLFTTAALLIAAAGHVVLALLFHAAVWAVQVILCCVLVPAGGLGAAAMADMGAWGLGVLLCGAFMVMRWGQFLPLGSVIRNLTAGALIWFLSHSWNTVGIHTLLKYAVLSVVYAVLLLALREVSSGEWRQLKDLCFGRKQSQS